MLSITSCQCLPSGGCFPKGSAFDLLVVSHCISLWHRASRATWDNDGIATASCFPQPGPNGRDDFSAGISETRSPGRGEALSG